MRREELGHGCVMAHKGVGSCDAPTNQKNVPEGGERLETDCPSGPVEGAKPAGTLISDF